jgi:aspartate-semialdehyde dehydrogenase
LSLDSVPDRENVVIAPPSLSPDGTQLALTMMADGLRVGGALTAVEILEQLI